MANSRRQCATCGSGFVARRVDGKYCSRRCRILRNGRAQYATRRNMVIASRPNRPCKRCGEPINPLKKAGTKYCGPKCRSCVSTARQRACNPAKFAALNLAASQRRAELRRERLSTPRACSICGVFFVANVNQRRVCSRKCSTRATIAKHWDWIIAKKIKWARSAYRKNPKKFADYNWRKSVVRKYGAEFVAENIDLLIGLRDARRALGLHSAKAEYI